MKRSLEAVLFAFSRCVHIISGSSGIKTGSAAGGITVQGVVDALEDVPFLNGAISGNLSAAARRRYETRSTITGGEALFRGSTPGSKHGYWVSQYMLAGNSNDSPAGKFLNLDGTNAPNNAAGPDFRNIFAEVAHNDGFVFFGTQIIDQRSIVAQPEVDYLTNWAAWLDSQNGVDANNFDIFLGRRRYLTTPRDIATYVHYDALYQAYLVACLLMANEGKCFHKDRGMPEMCSGTRAAFASFGGPHVLSLVTEVATRALKAVWRQKWMHHRRMRPEGSSGADHAPHGRSEPSRAWRPRQCGGSLKESDSPVATCRDRAAQYGAEHCKPDQAENDAVGRLSGLPEYCRHRKLPVPMAFPEGSPTHAAYGGWLRYGGGRLHHRAQGVLRDVRGRRRNSQGMALGGVPAQLLGGDPEPGRRVGGSSRGRNKPRLHGLISLVGISGDRSK